MTEPHPDPRVGLCSVCAHARPIRSGKGSLFWLCGRAAEEQSRFAKYPALPVLRCPGFEVAEPEER